MYRKRPPARSAPVCLALWAHEELFVSTFNPFFPARSAFLGLTVEALTPSERGSFHISYGRILQGR